MAKNDHQRALWLIDAARIEGISADDRAWLNKHLGECSRCQERERSTERALRALRPKPISISPSLVSTTQFRVRLRARELREESSRLRALVIACGLSWVMGVASAPLLWRGFEWIGQLAALPPAIWETAFFLSWLVPAAVVGGVFAWWKMHSSGDEYVGDLPR